MGSGGEEDDIGSTKLQPVTVDDFDDYLLE